MVIQHSILGLNASMALAGTNRKITSSTQKLSSGYRINKSADDAAGLSISEKMRKKIRGLEKGMENVQDGISLCQVADGALNEVTDLFQRARELSIKAYNGTNSKSDRQMIQDEIDQCLTEVDRIFETTKFNEIKVFQNGHEVQGTYLDTQPYTYTKTETVYKDLPSWLKINDNTVSSGTYPKIQEHSGNGYDNIIQDTTGIMMQDFELADKSKVKLYFGPDKGNIGEYQWVGDYIKDSNNKGYSELMTLPGQKLYDYFHNANGSTKHLDAAGNYIGWTPGISDNVSAKIDFKELSTKNPASELYNALTELVGTELGFTCGTCARMEAIRFGGEYEGMSGLKFYDLPGYLATSEIDLSKTPFSFDGKDYKGYFDAVAAVMAMPDSDPDKASKTSLLADMIASDLAEKTYQSLNADMKYHYDRVARDAGDQYSVYVYDYRDTDAATPEATASFVKASSYITFSHDEVDYVGREVAYDYYDEGQIWIQASDDVPDGLFINTAYLSLKKLDLCGYTVNRYFSEVTMNDPEGYYKRLAQWEKDAPEPRAEKYTAKVEVLKSYTPPVIESAYIDGELTRKMIAPPKYESELVDRELIRYVYDNDTRGPKPTPDYSVKEIYDPSELQLLDDALATVNKVRSSYGASQNRLEHTYRNNNNAHENLTYAESRIRDTDMAEEMVNSSKLNILQKAGLSMLTQANQINQNVSMLLS